MRNLYAAFALVLLLAASLFLVNTQLSLAPRTPPEYAAPEATILPDSLATITCPNLVRPPASLPSLIYFEDLPADSSYAPSNPPPLSTQATSTYLLFVTDSAGWNNVRLCFEAAVYLALATQRVLVLPPTQGWQHNANEELGLENVHRLADVDLQIANFKTISFDEFVKRNHTTPFEGHKGSLKAAKAWYDEISEPVPILCDGAPVALFIPASHNAAPPSFFGDPLGLADKATYLNHPTFHGAGVEARYREFREAIGDNPNKNLQQANEPGRRCALENTSMYTI